MTCGQVFTGDRNASLATTDLYSRSGCGQGNRSNNQDKGVSAKTACTLRNFVYARLCAPTLSPKLNVYLRLHVPTQCIHFFLLRFVASDNFTRCYLHSPQGKKIPDIAFLLRWGDLSVSAKRKRLIHRQTNERTCLFAYVSRKLFILNVFFSSAT